MINRSSIRTKSIGVRARKLTWPTFQLWLKFRQTDAQMVGESCCRWLRAEKPALPLTSSSGNLPYSCAGSSIGGRPPTSPDSSTESRGDGRSLRPVEVEQRRNTSKLCFGTL